MSMNVSNYVMAQALLAQRYPNLPAEEVQRISVISSVVGGTMGLLYPLIAADQYKPPTPPVVDPIIAKLEQVAQILTATELTELTECQKAVRKAINELSSPPSP